MAELPPSVSAPPMGARRPGSPSPKRRGALGACYHGHAPGTAWIVRAERLRHRRRMARLTVGGAMAAVVMAALALLVVLPFPPVLVPYLAGFVENRLGGVFNVDIGSAAFDALPDGDTGLTLSDVVLQSHRTGSSLEAPRVEVSLRGSRLWTAREGPGTIVIRQPVLRLALAEWDENAAVETASSDDIPGGPALLARLAAGAFLPASGPLARLTRLEIRDATVIVETPRGERAVRDLHLTVNRDGETVFIDTRGQFADTAVPLTAELFIDRRADGGFDIAASMASVPLAVLLDKVMRRPPPMFLDGRVDVLGSMRVGADGEIVDVAMDAQIARFEAVMRSDPLAALSLDNVTISADWTAANATLSINRFDVRDGDGSGGLVGRIWRSPTPNLATPWRFYIQSNPIVFTGRRDSAALTLDGLTTGGGINPQARTAVMDFLTVRSPLINGAAVGSLDFSARLPRLEMSIAASEIDAGALARLWPPISAPRTKALVTRLVRAGKAYDVRFAARGLLGAGPGTMETLLDMRFEDAALKVGPDLPPLEGLDGTISVANHRLDVNVSGGRLVDRLASDDQLSETVPVAPLFPGTQAGPADIGIILDEGRIQVEDMRIRTPDIGVTLAFAGDAAPFATLVRTGRIPGVNPAIIPDTLSPEGPTTARVGGIARTPPGEPPQMRDIALILRSDALRIPNGIAGQTLSEGNLMLDLNPASLALTGAFKLGDAPVNIEALSRRDADGLLQGAIATFSFDPSRLPGQQEALIAVKGPVAARLTMPDVSAFDGATLEADLTGAAITVKPATILKQAGSAGVARATVVRDGDGFRLDGLDVTAAPLVLRGGVRLAVDGRFDSADLSTFRLSAADDAALRVERRGATGLRLAIDGASFDARPLIAALLGGSMRAGGEAGSLSLRARLGTVIGHNDAAMAGVALDVERGATQLSRLDFAARLGTGDVGASLEDAATSRVLLRAADGGEMLRFLGLYRRVRGGEVALSAEVRPGGGGNFRARDFMVVGETALERVTSGNAGTSGTGAREVPFQVARVDYRQEDGRLIVSDGAIWGPEIGATMEGTINYPRDLVELRGTFVPAYALNNLFGRIPVLGAILGGGRREGLFGVTYRVTGPISAPVLEANPASVIAPGIFRRLFEFRQAEGGASAPAN